MAEEIGGVQAVKKPRKSIGEEGSRKQTLIGVLVTVLLSAGFYLSSLKPEPKLIEEPKKINHEKDEIIRIIKPRNEPSSEPKIIKKLGESEATAAIQALLSGQPGEFGIMLKSLDNKAIYALNDNLVLTAASVIKLPVLVAYWQAVDKGILKPDKIYVLEEADRLVYGSGSMQNQAKGTEYTYEKIAWLAAKESDNMAAELLVKFLGGKSVMEKNLKAWGLTKTSYQENETTAADMVKLWQKIYDVNFLKTSSREKLLASLTDTILETRIPAGVPAGVKVRHKFGSEAGVVNDCGVVEAKSPYILCILSTGVNDGDAETILPQISEIIWSWLGK